MTIAWLRGREVGDEHQRAMGPDQDLRDDDRSWSRSPASPVDVHLVHAQLDLDLPRFTQMFVELMSAPTPHGDGSKR